MALQDQFEHGRIPLKPLAFENKDLAQKGELMIDHSGDNPTYHLYIVDPNDVTKIVDLTGAMVREAFGNSITVNIEGIDEPLSLHDVINFIYKRFTYPDNSDGFNYDTDRAKVVDPNTKVVILRDVDGCYYIPITRADTVFDESGHTIQERLDSLTRLGFSNAYIQVEEDNQNIFDITYPFMNYSNGGNYMELRVGTTYLDKTRYQVVDKYDEDGNIFGATITFFNDKFEKDRRIDILFIYNTAGIVSGEYLTINGGEIANFTIPTSKLEKTTSNYMIPDATSIPTSKALYDAYKDLTDMIAEAGGNACFAVDTTDNPNNINVDISGNGIAIRGGNILVTILTKSVKYSDIRLTIQHDPNSFVTNAYDLHIPKGVAKGRLLKVLVNSTQATVLGTTDISIKYNRFIANLIDQQTHVSFSGLAYNDNSTIKVYRNGARLFEDLDYTMDYNSELIMLYVRAEEGERIVFEAESIEY